MGLEGNTLVILPGWGHDKSFWETFAARFTSLRVVIIELPGFGAEPIVSTEWGVPEYAEWVEQRIQTLGLTSVVLLGHSFGGRIAATLAAQRPTWLSKLVLYAAPLLYRPNTQVSVRRFLSPFVPSFLKGRSETQDLSEARTMGLEDVFKRVVVYDLTTELPKISVPTLLLWGSEDRYPSVAIAEEAQKLIPGVRLEVVHGAGHNVHLEKPDLFYGHITQFI